MKKGFTLIELLVVLSILAMLLIGGYQAYKAISNQTEVQTYE